MAGGRAASDPVYRQVVEIVASRALCDPEDLLPETHLEGELGIDAATCGPLLDALRRHFERDVPPLATAGTLAGLAEAVRRAMADRAAGDAADPGPAAQDQEGDGAERTGADVLTNAVLDTVMRHTGYQRHHLDLDADLEGDLGVDSVVLSAVVTDVARELQLPDVTASAITVTSLRGLMAALRPHLPAVPDDDASPVGRQGLRPWDGRSMKDFMEMRDRDLFAKAREFRRYLRQREREQLYWYGMPLESRCQNRARIHDELTGRTRDFLMFASNNYLGLANHPKVIDAICEATRAYGATNTGSRIIGGTNVLHKELERRLAAFKGRPACAVFPGGYSANLGTISGLARSYDTLVVDKFNHMSIVDGGRLSGATRRIYRHNDMADLERILRRCRDDEGGRLIVADGVFSMHGDVCNLPEIVRLAKTYGARVLVDDAHSTGVLGSRGSGTAEHFGLKDQVDLEIGTMSKTLSGIGGFVAGDEDVIDYLRFYANSYVFAATIPAGVAAGIIASIDVIETEPERISRLWSNIRLLRGRLLDAGFDLERSESAILPIVVGDERLTMEFGRAVRQRGLFCQTVVFPGVPLGDARLRVSVTCEHTAEDLERAAEIFVDAARETGVPLTPGGAGAR